MKTLLYYCLLALGLTAAAPARAQGPDWVWTTSMGWPGRYGLNQDVLGTRVAATADGGALVGVTFAGFVNFGGRRDTLVSLGEADGAVVKYSAAGVKQWTVRIRGLREEEVRGLGTDQQGNVYVAGTHWGDVYFSDAGDFLPGSGAFLAKYTAAGAFVSAVSVGQNVGGRISLAVYFLRVAPDGGCVLVGVYDGTVTVGPFTLNPVPNARMAIMIRVSPAGVVTGVSSISGPSTGPEVRSAALLPNGDVVLAGRYGRSVTFSPTVGLTSAVPNNFAVCYTAAGAVRWARQLPLDTNVAASPAGPLYGFGGFGDYGGAGGTLALDTLRATSGGGRDVFVARLDAGTGAAQGLAYAGGGPGDQHADELAFTAAGLPTLLVSNNGAARFGAVSVLNPGSGYRQHAAVQFSAAWQPQRAFATETQLGPRIQPALALSPQNDVFILVTSRAPQSFGRLSVVPQGDYEVVLARTGLVLAARPGTAFDAGVRVYPNPARATATVAASAALGVVAATLYDGLGRQCWAGPVAGGQATVPVAGLAPGVYWLRLRTADGRWLVSRLAVQQEE